MQQKDKELLTGVANELSEFLFKTEFSVTDLGLQINGILKTVEGTSNLLNYLNKDTDFFMAPASTRFHSSHVGGLALHSLSVTLRLVEKVLSPSFFFDSPNNNGINYENVIMAGLMHDLCKANFYQEIQKWRKDSRGKWESYSGWDVKDQFPIGHGEKSVMLLNRYWESNPVVDIAIRWHMGPFTTTNAYDFSNAANAHPLITLLHTADMESTYVYEVKNFTLNKFTY